MAYTTIDDPTIHFNTVLFTGTASGNKAVTGVGFQPDFVWTKNRVDAYGTVIVVNFGQEGSFAGNKTASGNSDANGYGDFFYSVPSGYYALNTKNLAEFG